MTRAWLIFHGSKGAAKVMMDAGRRLEDILRVPVVSSAIVQVDYSENLVRLTLNRAISDDVIRMSAQEYLKLKLGLLRLNYDIINKKIQNRQDNVRVEHSLPVKQLPTVIFNH